MTAPTIASLLARTAELIEIPSVSFEEQRLADHIERLLRPVPWLSVERVGDNVVARTELGRPQRVILAGHTDTVPGSQALRCRQDGDTLWGLGAADMKAGLAVMLEIARSIPDPALDVSYVFYAREEVAGKYSGLEELFVQRPDLVSGDAAILGEPTLATIEAGCQGTLRARVTVTGTRAHTARPWMGRNAIHRLAPILDVVGRYQERRPIIGGLEFREALQAVAVEGGVAGNVVPDIATVVLNHRYAPDRSLEGAFGSLTELLSSVLGPTDTVELVESSPAAGPGIDHPLLSKLADLVQGSVRPKLGWTDVARFASRGVPAVNFGPGDSAVAHTADERVESAHLQTVYQALTTLLTTGA